MSHKPKTPEELALERAGKKSVSLYLSSVNIEGVKKIAGATPGVSTSEIVDEAISFYLKSIKRQR